MDALKRLEQLMEQRLGNEPASDHSDNESSVLNEDSESGREEASCKSDDSFDSAGEQSEEEAPDPKRQKVVPIVVVHQEFDSRNRSSQPDGIRIHSFMSSKLKIKTGENELVKRFKSAKEIDQDKQNKDDDTELESLIKTSKIVEQFNAEQLTGKDRQRYQKKQLIKLGGKAPLSFSARAPKPIRLGSEKKTIKTAQKKLQEAKDMGMWTKDTNHIYEDAVLTKKAPSMKRKWDRKGDVNKPSVGRFKNGILTVGKREIEQHSSKFNGGGKKRMIGSVGMKATRSAGLGSGGSGSGNRKRRK